MATRESRRQRGRRQGEAIVQSVTTELRTTRVGLGLSQQTMSKKLGCSQSEYSRFELARSPSSRSLVRLSEAAAILGLELSVGVHPAGPPIRDKGHQALITRFRKLLSSKILVRAEVPLPGPGDPRVWDLVLQMDDWLIGVEAETRIRDLQALVRRIRDRERDGGVDEIIILLSDSAVNRRLVAELREALGEPYATSTRGLLKTLRTGSGSPVSGVLLI
jgi:transcriptional regulator with XRE-family HTH domain